MLRGWNEEVLTVTIEADAETASPNKPVERMIAAAYEIGNSRPGDRWLMEVAGWAWRVKLSMSLSLDLMRECANAPRKRRSTSSPAISRTCCWPRPPARAPRWASIRASAPASRSPSSTHRQGGRHLYRLSVPADGTTCAARRWSLPR
jgi:hypothetical protein